ncbi:equilibrative nucleoside transporter 2-like [Cololabis saira]|uniref:equilibrative nucleoside transporter 2-like n=1 Tax=Cololabis saira TaxID=129043 RepID=UPI002AD4B82D|nr:equilibrative nucleoside transporter 2-like [Cololabis saira]
MKDERMKDERTRDERTRDERTRDERTPPSDRGSAVAVIVFVLGLGTLLPWNFFITASQYFNERLGNGGANATANATASGGAGKSYNYDSWMALLSQLPLLLFTLLNSFLYQWVQERFRVSFSLVSIFVLFALTAALVQVPMTPDTFFSVTMATIWFINMFSAVLQGSLFGLLGRFPPRYSTLFMSGQGLAGIFAAAAMLVSILTEPDSTSAALGYFITPCSATLVTLLCYLLLPHLDFARFHLNRHDETEKEKEPLGSAGRYQEPLGTARNWSGTGLVAEEKRALDGTGKDLEAAGTAGGSEENQDQDQDQTRSSVADVFKKIWVMSLSVTCVFAVTLSVFPVITVRVRTVYTDNAAWDRVFTCVCCFLVFNVMDLAGRGAPSLVQWPPKQSRLFPAAVASRLVFVPLLMTCNVEGSRTAVLFRHDAAFVLIMAAFAFSNGYLASLCMAYAPQLVRCRDAETAGSLMTFFLVLGLAVGASFSFLLGTLV